MIRRFTADIEPAALGWTIEAFVEVYCEGRVPPERMREMVSAIPEVVEAYTVTGEADGILRVRAADTATLRRCSASSATTRASRVPDHRWFSPDSDVKHARGFCRDMRHSRPLPLVRDEARRAEPCVKFCRVRLKQ